MNEKDKRNTDAKYCDDNKKSRGTYLITYKRERAFMELCIKNAKVVDWCKVFKGDVYIKDGIITEIGKDLKKNCNTIDADGLTLMPSFIDFMPSL